MTRALVIQLVEALQDSWNPAICSLGREEKAKAAITAAREYLATEPSGERAELINELRTAHAGHTDEGPSAFSDAADMLEADAQQAKRVPMSDDQMWALWNSQGIDYMDQREAIAFARAVEAHRDITEREIK